MIMEKTIYKFIFLVIAILLNSPELYSQTKYKKQQSEIQKVISHSYENNLFNGAILVTQDGEIIYKNALGIANKETKKNLTTESSFYLASVSKQFTTMAIMILKEQNKLKYTDVLSKYFPEFPKYADHVTIRQLMTHTAGIPDHYNLGAYKAGLTNKDVINLLIKQKQLDFKPGTKHRYSNGGYILLADIVEKVAKLPFHIFMKQNIFKPLGMDHTLVFDKSTAKIDNRAIGYNHLGELDDYEILTTGAGGIYSTLDDLHKWDQALYTDRLISQKTLEEAFTPATLTDGNVTKYGFGWYIKNDNKNKSVVHLGSLSGYKTLLKRNFDDNSGYIILTNKGAATPIMDISRSLDRILDNKPYTLPKIPITRELLAALKDYEAQRAITKTEELLKNNPEKYSANKFYMTGFGYGYLSEEKTNTAIAIFKLMINLYPNSVKANEGLADAYLANGQTAEAISSYKKVLTLDPENQSVKSELAKLN